MVLTIIQLIDKSFTTLIFLPAIYILYYKFAFKKERGRAFKNIYHICTVLVVLFVLRIFCEQFIFTEVNFNRFTSNGLFPLIKVIFY